MYKKSFISGVRVIFHVKKFQIKLCLALTMSKAQPPFPPSHSTGTHSALQYHFCRIISILHNRSQSGEVRFQSGKQG